MGTLLSRAMKQHQSSFRWGLREELSEGTDMCLSTLRSSEENDST